ncbi:hypothetical protein PAXINDRAFT_99884, partial [Paxillus involutus ATCC 200175]
MSPPITDAADMISPFYATAPTENNRNTRTGKVNEARAERVLSPPASQRARLNPPPYSPTLPIAPPASPPPARRLSLKRTLKRKGSTSGGTTHSAHSAASARGKPRAARMASAESVDSVASGGSIREILLGVFELVFTSENRYPDLARLAKTCRSFHGPALDLLWREQPSLLPLVMCFPREILDFSETSIGGRAVTTVKFAKVPSVQDWERPSVYVTYIRRMSNSVPLYIDAYKLHASVLQTLLESCPSTPLLPNLRHLNYDVITGNSEAYVTSVSRLFSPNLLQSLTFGSYYRLALDDNHAFLMHLFNHCPQIEFLYISLLARSFVDIVKYITSLASLRHLTSFNFTVVGSAPDSHFRPPSIN